MLLRVVTFCVGLMLATGTARADAWKDCQDDDPDLSIKGCSEIINKGRPPQKLSEAYYHRGLAYGNKGDNDRAIADYTKAIEIDPKYFRPYLNRGSVYARKGDPGRAISDFNRTIEIDPGYAISYYNRATAYTHKGEYDRAIADFTKAIEIDPEDAEAYSRRGEAYDRKGEHDHQDADAYNERAWAYFKAGMVAQALPSPSN